MGCLKARTHRLQTTGSFQKFNATTKYAGPEQQYMRIDEHF